MTNPVPPGWYDDPDGSPDSERLWDGHNWTPQRRVKTLHTPPHTYPQPPYPQPPYPQPPYPQQAGPYPAPGQVQSVAAANLFSIIAFVCAGLSLLVFPVIFGPAGLILGAVGFTKKERFAPIAVAAAAGCMIAGMVIGAALWSPSYY